MANSPQEVLVECREHDVKAVSLYATDVQGNWRGWTVPVSRLNEESFEDGFEWPVEGLIGAEGQIRDVLLIPQPATAFVMPHAEVPTLGLICNLYSPLTREELPDCSRSLAERAQKFALESGIADEIVFGLSAEFFLLRTAANTNRRLQSPVTGLHGHTPFPAAESLLGPQMLAQASADDFLNALMLSLIDAGVGISSHHQPYPDSGKSCLQLGPSALVPSADRLMLTKHLVKRFARLTGRRVSFAPVRSSAELVLGLPIQLSLLKQQRSVLAGSGYAGLSDVALYAVGGILKHAAAIFAFSSYSASSFARLQRLHLDLAYSANDARAVVRVPSQRSSSPACVEYRGADALCNPYLTMTALLMAALDGIQNKIQPGRPLEPDPYSTLEGSYSEGVTTGGKGMIITHEAALAALAEDGEFLTRGDVITAEVLDDWISEQRALLSAIAAD